MTIRALLRRTAAVAAAGLVAVLLAAPPALAHASLVGETPKGGSTVGTAPRTVVFRFDENIRQPSKVIVTGPRGERVDHGSTAVLDNTASVAVSMGERGEYTASYRVISADGHPVTAQTRFDYQGRPSAGAQPASRTAGTGTPRSSSGGAGQTLWVVVGVLVVLVAAAALLLAGRRRQPPASDTGEDLGTAADQPRSSP